MTSGPATPPAEEPPRDGPGAPANEPRHPPTVAASPRGDERYGPLHVLRTRKDDGRSLTLYSREQDAGAARASPAADERRAGGV